jgi:hypothetical protein
MGRAVKNGRKRRKPVRGRIVIALTPLRARRSPEMADAVFQTDLTSWRLILRSEAETVNGFVHVDIDSGDRSMESASQPQESPKRRLNSLSYQARLLLWGCVSRVAWLFPPSISCFSLLLRIRSFYLFFIRAILSDSANFTINK